MKWQKDIIKRKLIEILVSLGGNGNESDKKM